MQHLKKTGQLMAARKADKEEEGLTGKLRTELGHGQPDGSKLELDEPNVPWNRRNQNQTEQERLEPEFWDMHWDQKTQFGPRKHLKVF